MQRALRTALVCIRQAEIIGTGETGELQVAVSGSFPDVPVVLLRRKNDVLDRQELRYDWVVAGMCGVIVELTSQMQAA